MYLSDQLHTRVSHFLASVKIQAQERVSQLLCYFFSFQCPGPLLGFPSICLQIFPLPLSHANLQFIQGVTLLMCVPNTCLDDNQRNSHLQPFLRPVVAVILGVIMT